MNEIKVIETLGNQLINFGTTDEKITLDQVKKLYSLGYSFYETGSYKKAKEVLKIVTTLSPFYTDALFALGMTYFQLKDFDLAIRAFEALEFIDPKNPLAALYIGYTLIEKNELTNSITFIEKAISKMDATHPQFEKAKLVLMRLNEHDFSN